MLSKNNYDIIILGGGISGLFIAYQLSKKDKSVLLIEKSKRYGGRIYTEQKNNYSYECGAARFHSSHTKLLSLLDELQMSEDIIELPSVLKHILRKKERNFDYKTDYKLKLDELLQQAVSKKKEFNKEKLHKVTFFQYLISIFDFETASFIKDAFGYDSEIIELNAEAALQMFSNDLFSENKYYVLKKGLSGVIQLLVSILEKRENVTMLNDCVMSEMDDKTITIPQGKFFYKKLICAIPPSSLKEINYFKDNQSLDAVKAIPLMRIYAKYPIHNNRVWFKDIKRTTTDNYLRHIIPINYKEGLIMISYTDGLYAEIWKQLHSCGEGILVKHLHKEIKDLYQIDPPKPEYISVHYWDEGLHVWKPGFQMKQLYKQILQPEKDIPIFLCGEGFSKKQGWIEGCLETCYDVINKLDIPGINMKN